MNCFSLLAFYIYSYKIVLKHTLRFFESVNEVKWLSQIKGTGDLSSTLRLFNLFDCYVIRTSQLTNCLVYNSTFNSFLFDWLIQNDVNCFYLQKYSHELHPFPVLNEIDMLNMALYVRTPWSSINSRTDLARSGAPDVNSGHYGTVGNPKLSVNVRNCKTCQEHSAQIKPERRIH